MTRSSTASCDWCRSAPAGGCLLTDEHFAARLRDLFAHSRFVTPPDLRLLTVGRQLGEPVDLDLNKVIADVTQLAYFGQAAGQDKDDVAVTTYPAEESLIVHAGAQDLSRVFVNMINNARDAGRERAASNGEFSPEVMLTARRNVVRNSEDKPWSDVGPLSSPVAWSAKQE